MALLACLNCSTRFAVGLPRCPNCSSTDYAEDDVAKITVSGGVSHPADHAPDDFMPNGNLAESDKAAAPSPEPASADTGPASEVVTEPSPPEPAPAPPSLT